MRDGTPKPFLESPAPSFLQLLLFLNRGKAEDICWGFSTVDFWSPLSGEWLTVNGSSF